MIETAANSGHDLANLAEGYEEKQDWSNAINAHNQAAVEFENATHDANDIQTINTLKLLSKTHAKKSQELQKKLNRINDTTAFDMKKLEQEIYAIQEGELLQQVPPMDESYAILSSTNNEEGDPFNKFWGVVEPMMDKLSNPVVFTPTPLHGHDDLNNANNNKIKEDVATAVVNEKESIRIQREMAGIIESFFGHPAEAVVAKGEEKVYTQNNSQVSFARDYKQENEDLKSQIQQITNQIQNLEKKSIDSTVLKSSIIQFKNDVHKQALRILQTQESAIMTRSATTAAATTTLSGSSLKNIRTMGGTSTAEIVNRIKELEDDNRNLSSQICKQEALMNKYRERWEKLKQGAAAKKRNNQPPTSNNTNLLLRTLASNHPPVQLSSPSNNEERK